MAQAPHEVVVLGAGIVGLCTAYYTLSLDPAAKVTLVEAARGTIAPGASSFAGGFLAFGTAWHEPPSQPLARLSGACHADLAERLEGDQRWGYRQCSAIGLNVGGVDEDRSKYRTLPGGKKEGRKEGEGGRLPRGEWVEGEKEVLSTEGGVAQLDPAAFCMTLHEHLSTTYADRFTTIFGRATALSPPNGHHARAGSSPKRTITILPHAADTSTSSSRPSPISVALDRLVIAAGPWSAAVCSTLGLPPIPLTNLPGHSLLIRPSLSGYSPHPGTTTLPSQAVFAGISGAVGGVHASTSGLARGLTPEEKAEGFTRSPEFFVRTNGLVYVAGENTIPETRAQRLEGLPNKLPESADEVREMIDERLVGRLKRAAGAVSPLLKEENGAVVERQQFCYRPIAPDREPIIGLLDPSDPTVYVSTAKGPWGITLAPGAGKVVAELLLGLDPSADISALSPRRFAAKAKL
ncbi:FAD dependent oxidoreductase [Rhodotorula diobovata]|uniref:FAD dependent oxidoreductase n=1 Tax=Rhodotorula diobovata TaxID=5288 RepID=A0A5C5G792_9BASI|nr:FAD dependent oxidoreductase [Rhodotorula diobovata]